MNLPPEVPGQRPGEDQPGSRKRAENKSLVILANTPVILFGAKKAVHHDDWVMGKVSCRAWGLVQGVCQTKTARGRHVSRYGIRAITKYNSLHTGNRGHAVR